MVKIKRVKEITPEIVDAFLVLMPQLTTTSPAPDEKLLESILESKDTYLFVAYHSKIVGTLTVVITKTPSGIKAWIEDVIVDSSCRGQHIGKMLVAYAIDFAKELNVSTLNLTSSPDRVVANQLYQSMGFALRETNVYRLTL